MRVFGPFGRSRSLIGRGAVAGIPKLFPQFAENSCVRAGLWPLAADEFDLDHYRTASGHQFDSAVGAIFHYLCIGSRLGVWPTANFDPAFYRRANPDVILAGYEPFAHYLRFGRAEGRGGTIDADGGPDDIGLVVPELGELLSRRRPDSKAASVDVVIPVYGNRALTLRAIESLLNAGTPISHELVIVDDASPDPVLRQELELLAERRLITLLTNGRNIGFVGSVNRGMALHPGRDVALLNSDTRVFGDWLGRLLCALRHAPRTGTATPLSNAATILSYPITLRDNHLPAQNDPAVLDILCARLGFSPVEVPTAHGFCMAISRKCLNEVGPFDVVNFGRGYGEENDFCLRASASGWRHVAATNVFVWHRGGASFGNERETRVAAAQVTLERLHPGYGLKVQRFIGQDPLKAIRAALDTLQLATAEGVTLRLVAEIGPFAGKYRFVPCDFPAVPNLPRLGPDLEVKALAEIMSNLAISALRLRAMDYLASPFRERVVTAAATVGIPVTAD